MLYGHYMQPETVFGWKLEGLIFWWNSICTVIHKKLIWTTRHHDTGKANFIRVIRMQTEKCYTQVWDSPTCQTDCHEQDTAHCMSDLWGLSALNAVTHNMYYKLLTKLSQCHSLKPMEVRLAVISAIINDQFVTLRQQFYGPVSRTTHVSRDQKKYLPILDF